MAKLNVTTLLEVSKALATKAGKELSDFITSMADFQRQTVSALRNDLTFADNFRGQVKTVDLSDKTNQIVSTNRANISLVLPGRVVSTVTRLDSFNWHINDTNQLVVNAGFDPAPSGQVKVTLVILFG